MNVLYIAAITTLAIAARWCWFQNSKTLRDLGSACLGFALFAFVGFLFTPSDQPWWARTIIGGIALFVGICGQDFLHALLEKREQQRRRAAPIPKGPVKHDFTISGYQSRGNQDDFNIV